MHPKKSTLIRSECRTVDKRYTFRGNINITFTSIFCHLITDRNPRPASCVDGGFEIGQVCYVINKFLVKRVMFCML